MRKAFTLMEIMVVLVIIGVLAALGIPSYQNIIEGNKAAACQANLQALKSALDAYVMDRNIIPGEMSQIPQEYIRTAQARMLRSPQGWRIRLARFFERIDQASLVYADLIEDLAAGNIKLLRCPAQQDPGRSYGISADLVGLSAEQYRSIARDHAVLGDCDQATFSSLNDLSFRHRHYTSMVGGEDYANYILADNQPQVKGHKGKKKPK